jgi:cyclophilin family peptidyl-prolyl cis-trans isomerase
VLLGAAGDTDYTVRVAAVQAVDALMLGEQLPSLLLGDPVFHVRAAVATAYGDSDKADPTPLSQLWTKDPSVTVRAAALSALALRMQVAAAPLLTMALSDASAEIRTAAVSSAGVLASDPAAQTLLLQGGLTDPTEQVRVAVLGQLGDVAQDWAYAAIKAALGAPGMAERGTAAGVLSARMEADRTAVAWASFEASAGRRWRDTRQALLDVFATDLSSQSTDFLRAAVQDPEPMVSGHALELLQARGVTDLPQPPAPDFAYSPFRRLRFAQNPVVTLTTTHGSFEIECFAQDAPVHVASFIGLVRLGTYDGLPWHRVVSDFVIQGGDPERSGWGDAGFSLRAEINEQRFDRGTLGMPRGDDFDTGGAQLFFNHIPTPHLDGQYTVFGQIRSGLPVVDQIEQGDLILTARVTN